MPAKVPAVEHMDRLRRDAEEVEERVRALVDGMTSPQLLWHPPEGGWNVLECLEHISMTNEMYVEASNSPLTSAPKVDVAEAPDFKPGMITARFIRMLEPGNGRYKAPKPFQPDRAGKVGTEALDRFFEVHAGVLTVIDRMATVDLTRTRVVSPLMSLVRFRIGDMMDFLLVHSKRHVQQAEKVTLHDDFPVAHLDAAATEEEE
jgi:DinB superfamily